MNKLKPGEINTLKVERATDIAYMLTNGEETVFLHYQEALNKLEDGEMIDVFLYYDNKKRLTATMLTPFITASKPGFVKVVDINEDLGVFVNNNIDKDLLISKDFLPYEINLWPKIGDELYCKINVKKNRLVGKIVSKSEVEDTFSEKRLLEPGEKIIAKPIRIGDSGTNFMSKEGHSIFVYLKHQRVQAKIGEDTEITITKVMDDGSYYGTIISNIPSMMNVDSETIYQYMKNNNGEMSYTAKSSAEEILSVFKMSKAAFKRALGHLYKKREIEILEDKVVIIKKETE